MKTLASNDLSVTPLSSDLLHCSGYLHLSLSVAAVPGYVSCHKRHSIWLPERQTPGLFRLAPEGQQAKPTQDLFQLVPHFHGFDSRSRFCSC